MQEPLKILALLFCLIFLSFLLLAPEQCRKNPVEKSDFSIFENYLNELSQARNENEKLALTEDFFTSIDYSGGFPIIVGNQVTFVYLQEYGINTPLSVAGDFNDWSPLADIMEKALIFIFFIKQSPSLILKNA